MYGILNTSEQLIAKFTAPLSIRNNRPTYIADSLSLKRFSTAGTAQRWEIEANLEPLSVNAQDLFMSLVLKGVSESVVVKVPQNYGAKKKLTASAVMRTNGVVAGGVTQFQVDGFTGVIPLGTFIKFSNHNKLYVTKTDLNGPGVLNVYPEVRTNIPDNTIIYYKDDVHVNFYYDTDVVKGMVYQDGILMDVGTVKLIEVL